MNRKTFLSITGGTIAAMSSNSLYAATQVSAPPLFKAKFAPHPGSFPSGPTDYLDQLKFAYDLGFRAWEDNNLFKQSNELIEKVAAYMNDKKMELGVSVIVSGSGAMLNKPTEEQKANILKGIDRGIEVVKITGQTNLTMVPGARDLSLSREKQIEASVDFMKMCCDLVESHGIVMVQEPLAHNIEGGEPLLRSFADGYMLCKLVGRASCKLLPDFYHEGQIGNGDRLIENAEAVWDECRYVQYGDVPGRKEPGTGDINYKLITEFLRKKNYTGIIGMEHGASKEGQEGTDALVKSYREIDA